MNKRDLLLSLLGPTALTGLVFGALAALHPPGSFAMRWSSIDAATIGAAGAATVVVTVLLALMARGRSVPAPSLLVISAIPLVAGYVSYRLALIRSADMIGVAPPTERAQLFAAGAGFGGDIAYLGAWHSAALAGATALVLACIALSRAATRRWSMGSAVPAMAFVFALVWIAIAHGRVADPALAAIVPTLVAAAACAIAAAGSGSPDARSSLGPAASAFAAAIMAMTCTVAAIRVDASNAVNQALSSVPDEIQFTVKRSLEIEAASAPAAAVVAGCGVLGLVLVLIRNRRSEPRLASVTASAAIASAIGLSPHAWPWLIRAAEPPIDLARLVWFDGTDVQLPVMSWARLRSTPQVAFELDGMSLVHEEVSSAGDALEKLARRLKTVYQTDRCLDVAVDARLGADVVGALANLGRDVSATRVVLTVRTPIGSIPPEWVIPSKLASSMLGGIELSLAEQTPELQAPIGVPPLLVRAVDGSIEPFAPGQAPASRRRGPVAIVPAEGFTAQRLVEAVAELTSAGFDPVLVTSAAAHRAESDQ